MKIRLDWCSNSSSSSFVINTSDITDQQLDLIKNHVKHIRNFFLEDSIPADVDFGTFDYYVDGSGWMITLLNGQVKGYTHLDNFSMKEYLKFIGVPTKVIKWKERDGLYES